VSATDEVIIPEYGFIVYEIATRSVSAVPVFAERNGEQMMLCADSILQKVSPKTKMIIIDHPGNPIGNYMPRQQIEKLIKNLPDHIILVIDAAYSEYMVNGNNEFLNLENFYNDYTDCLEFVLERKNVVVTRSFSKAYGLAGVRLGWLCAPDSVIEVINRYRAPFKVSEIAQRTGMAALSDLDFIKKSINHTSFYRTKLESYLSSHAILGPHCYSNFVLAKFSSKAQATDFVSFLKDHNILVLHLTHYGLDCFVRISIGSQESMELLMSLDPFQR
jgi:histidinol-phosphate aminotransferase